MYDLREVFSLVRAYTIKRRKIKLILKRKAQLHFKIAFWKRCWESCPLAQLEYQRIKTPLHVQKQVILHCQGERLFCYNHCFLKYVLTRSFGSNSLNHVWFVKTQNILCHFFHSNKTPVTYLDPTAFLLLYQDTNFSFWESYLCFLSWHSKAFRISHLISIQAKMAY